MQLQKKRSIVVLRISGEVCTKADITRRQFHKVLKNNIKSVLNEAGIEFRLTDQWFRLDVETEDPRAAELLAQIFGIQEVCQASVYEWETIDDIVAMGDQIFAADVAGETFAVRARRVGPREAMPFRSVDVERLLGAKLVERGGIVNLKNHTRRVALEVRENEVYFFEREIAGPAGLPIGTEGNAFCLMSGGFDSAVAAWLIMLRGVAVDFVFFDLGGTPHQRGVRQVTDALVKQWAHGYSPRLHIIDFRPVVAEMKEKVGGQYWQLLLKRLMVRTTHLLVDRTRKVSAMVTGEAIGQVSSQTLANLAAISGPIETPVLRPLVGFNKENIIQKARDIGTYEASAGVPEFCALGGGKPITRGDARSLTFEEQKIDPELLEMMIAHRTVLEKDEIELRDEVTLEISAIPESAAVIDVRSRAEYNKWAYPGAMHLEFTKALDNAAILPKSRTYVFYCDVGLKSAFLAETMHKMGFKAYSYDGGLRRLKKYAATLETV